jgi:2-oxoisovalerate dehydrogenase E1 component
MSRKKSIELAIKIRTVENNFLKMFSKGLLHGTVHTSVGQEFSAVAFCDNLQQNDFVFSNHRCHGHFIARTKDLKSLIAELMGKKSGVCGGIGGSQHLRKDNFYSNGPQGALTPVAVGAAYGIKLRKLNNLVLCFIGDGSMGEGIVYESMNLASLYKLPILFVCENNAYAQSTPIKNNLAGSILDRAKSFGLQTFEGDTWNWEKLISDANAVLDEVREGNPSFFLVNTYRLNAHSKGDDQRDSGEVAKYFAKDPLNELITQDPEVKQLEKLVAQEISVIVDNLLVEQELNISDIVEIKQEISTAKWTETQIPSGIKQVDEIYSFFKEAIKQDENLLIIGEDIAHPYGGAFNITRDLSLLYPKNIISTPISEAGITGMGIGLSLVGYKPFVEIMFGDFISYAFDQLLSNASKFFGMYNKQVHIPLVVRTPMGGGRGYGPTHSQSLEKHFFGLNNLTIVAPNYFSDTRSVYTSISKESDTVLLIENKIDYGRLKIDMPKNISYDILTDNSVYPNIWFKPNSNKVDITIVTYGGGLQPALASVDDLFYEYELTTQIICITQIYPLHVKPFIDLLNSNRIILTVEEGNIDGGFGSEVIANLSENAKLTGVLFARVGSENIPIPTVKSLEEETLVNKNKILKAVKELG